MKLNNKKPYSRPVTRVSKSGRIIKTPKAILTTSSDDAPSPMSTTKGVSVQSELQRPRDIAKKLGQPKNSVVEPEETAVAAIEESFEDLFHDGSEQNMAISMNIEQADLQDTRKSSYVATQQMSSMRKEKPGKSMFIASLTAQPINRGISSLLPRKDSMNEPNMDVGRENPHEHLEEHRAKSPEVDFNMMENLKKIVQQNKDIQEQLEVVKRQNKNIIEQQKQIIEQFGTQFVDEEISQKLYEPPEGFPLETVEQFRELENDPCRKARKKLYTFLCNIGGTTPKDFLKFAFKHVMTDELIESFSWPGGKNSEKFGDTKVANVLYLAAKKCPLFRGPETKAEFKTDVLELFRTTKQRYRNSLKRGLAIDTAKKAELEIDEADEGQLLRKIRWLEARANSEPEDFDADVDTDEQECCV